MSRGTPHRTMRIEDDLWDRAQAKAKERGEHVSDAVRRALELYAEDQHPSPSDPFEWRGAAHIANCPDCQQTFG